MNARFLALGLCGVLTAGATAGFAGKFAPSPRPLDHNSPASAPKAGDEEDEKGEKDEHKIPVSQVPPAVVDAVKKALPDGHITDAEEGTFQDQKVVEVDVKSGDKEYELKVTPDGKVLKQDEEKPDNDKKDEKDEKDEKGK